MKAWYSKVRDTELKDGSVRATYVVTFETDNADLKREVEKYLQGIMDKTEPTISKMEQVEDETRLTAKCLNCANGSSYKCSKCDGEMYYKYDKDEPQTDCAWKKGE